MSVTFFVAISAMAVAAEPSRPGLPSSRLERRLTISRSHTPNGEWCSTGIPIPADATVTLAVRPETTNSLSTRSRDGLRFRVGAAGEEYVFDSDGLATWRAGKHKKKWRTAPSRTFIVGEAGDLFYSARHPGTYLCDVLIEQASTTKTVNATPLPTNRLDITTLKGVRYESCRVMRIEPDGISVAWSNGVAKIPFADLSQEMKSAFGYEPQSAAAYAKHMTETRQDAAKARQEALARQKDEAAAEEEKRAAEEVRRSDLAQKRAQAKRIRGRIIQATDRGFLVDAPDRSGVVSSSASSIGGGGNVYVPSDPSGRNRPEAAHGTFWVVDYPNAIAKVDDDWIDVDAYEDGTYSYTTVVGASSRVRQYTVLKAY